MASNTIESDLQLGLEKLGLQLSVHQKTQLLDYLALLLKWNKAFNLSGVKDAPEMLSRHLLDSLTLVPFIKGQRILDVGTGPGLPGIPLAICFPEKDFILLDSNGKKTRFVFQSKLELGLSNVEIHNLRVENYRDTNPVDVIVCRAFSSLGDLIKMTRHLSDVPGKPGITRIVAMKGIYPAEELAQLPAEFVLSKVERVDVPGCSGERHIIELTPSASEFHSIG